MVLSGIWYDSHKGLHIIGVDSLTHIQAVEIIGRIKTNL